MKNYRKAAKGDIPCPKCVHYHKPFAHGMRGRCRVGNGPSTAVGKTNTCDDANASVLATSPKLLDILEDCVESLESIERNYPGLTGYGVRQSRIDQAKKVIAKARGEG